MNAPAKSETSSSCFWGHSWTFWTVINEGEITKDGKTKGFWLLQERRCAGCGKVERDMNEQW